MDPAEFLALPPAQAIAALRQRVPTLPDDYYARAGDYRQHAFSIAGIAALDALQEVLDGLQGALEKGESFVQWQRRAIATPGLGALPKSRLDNIFRTNLQGAYQRGIYERQAEVTDRRPFLMYDAVNDARTRPSHRAMDGFIARHDDPIWRRWRPPAGYRCRCTLIALTEAQARARGYGTQTRPAVEPDPGWDYDRAAGIAPGVVGSIERRRSLCNAGAFAQVVRTRPLWCVGLGAAAIGRYALAGARREPMPTPRPAPGAPLAIGQGERYYVEQFMAAFHAGPRDEVIFDPIGPGVTVSVSDRIFWRHDERRVKKAEKRGRGPYVRWIAEAIENPDEAWYEARDRGATIRLVARFERAGSITGVVAVFRQEDDGSWVAISGYPTAQDAVIDGVRRGVMVYRRVR